MDPSIIFHAPAVADAIEHFAHAIENASGSVLGKAGANWIVERFGRFYKKFVKDDDEQTQVIVMNRLVEMYEALDAFLIEAKEAGIIANDFRQVFAEPQASRLIDAACIAATETDDPTKRDLLARLIADRIVSPNESRHAIYLRIGVEAIRDLQPRHLSIVGQIFLVQWLPFPPLIDKDPNDGRDPLEKAFEIYDEWLAKALSALTTTTAANAEDMAHLQSLGLIVPSSPSQILDNFHQEATHENGFVQALLSRDYPENLVRRSSAVKKAAVLLDARPDPLSRDWGSIALGDYELTGSGQILAIAVLRQNDLNPSVNTRVYDDIV